ncbi:MAG: CRISPR-associated protein Cas4 [Eubacteriaceae bacterium]
MKKEITGVMVYYSAVCQRKLWYFYQEIQMEGNHDNVMIGKLLDENAYQREDKHININNVINIDFLRAKGVLHEVKKSKKIEEASILQVKYYLYYLKKRGVNGIIGKIDYPLLKQNIDIFLEEKDVDAIEKTLDEIEKVISLDSPPVLKKLRICKSCAYYDLCYI